VVWKVNSTQKWEDMCLFLMKYKEREGHCNVPRTHKEDGETLGIWLKTQRLFKRKGMLKNEEHIRTLEDLGVIWDPYYQRWQVMYALLSQYNENEGHCRVPPGHIEDGENLGTWLNNQRIGKTTGKLNDERQRQLEELGVEWKLRSTKKWEYMFVLLVRYNDKTGSCNVPQDHIEDGENLGIWLKNQRQAKKKEKLNNERKQKLEDLGVEWE